MPDNHGRSPRPNNGLHGDCLSFATSSHGGYAAGLGTLRASGGDIGGEARCLFCKDDSAMSYGKTQKLPLLLKLGGGEGGNNLPMILWSDYISDDPTPKVGGALLSPSKQNGGDA